MASDVENSSIASPSSTTSMSTTSNISSDLRPTFNFINASTVRTNEQMFILKKAAKIVQHVDGIVEGISEEDCMEVKGKEPHTFFVTDQFDGPVFEHLREKRCRIVSPHLIISCFTDRIPIPKYSRPLYNTSMQGLTVCCSSLEPAERLNIQRKVEFMMGLYSKELHSDVTHLVTSEVGSKKYKVASENKVKVISPDWVYSAWDVLCKENINSANDESFVCQFYLPIFKGLTVTASGLAGEDRQEVERSVVVNGGLYSGPMKQGDCTHLITNTTTSEKYRVAKKWGIHTVTIDWLFDSLKKKYAVDEGLYDPAELLKDPKKPKGSSTPTEVKHRDRLSMGIDLDCSAIGGARANMTVCSNASMSGNRTLVNETISSADRTAKPNKPVAKLIPNMDATTLEASKVMAPPATVVKAPRNKKVSSLQSTSEAIDKDETPIELLDLTVSTSGSFLDNCRIYVNGFNGQSTEILRKIINAGGGTRLNKLDASVTHFIVGKRPNESDLRKVKDNQLKCHVIDHRWLSQSFKRSKLQPVEPYFVEGFEPKQIITEEKAPTNPAKKMRTASIKSRPSDLSARANDQTEELDDTAMGILSSYLPNETTRMEDPVIGDITEQMEEEVIKGDSDHNSSDHNNSDHNNSEAENIPENNQQIPKTPAIKENKESKEHQKTPANQSLQWDTPGKYLDADKSFHPQYQFDDMDTTDVDEDNKRDDTGTFLDKQLAIAAEQTSKSVRRGRSSNSSAPSTPKPTGENNPLLSLMQSKWKGQKANQSGADNVEESPALSKRNVYGRRDSPRDRLETKRQSRNSLVPDRQSGVEVGWADQNAAERQKMMAKMKPPDQATPSLEID